MSSSPLFLPKHTLNMDRSPPPQTEMTWIFLLLHSPSRITLKVCLWINFASFFHYTTAMLPFLKLNKGQNSTTRSPNDMNTLSIESAHVHYPTMFLILFCGLFSPPDFISFASKKEKKVIFSTKPNFRELKSTLIEFYCLCWPMAANSLNFRYFWCHAGQLLTFGAHKNHKMCVFSTTTSFHRLKPTLIEFPNHRIPMTAKFLNFRYFWCHAGELMTFGAHKNHKMCVFSTTTSFYKLQTTSIEFPNHRLPMAANSLNFRYLWCHAGELMTFDAPKNHKMCVFSTTTSFYKLQTTSNEFPNHRLPMAANSLNFRYFSCHAGDLMTFDAPKIHKMCVFSTTTSCHQLQTHVNRIHQSTSTCGRKLS